MLSAATTRLTSASARPLARMFATQTAASLAGPETRMTTLPNGLRVCTENNGSETASVGVWIDTGSRYETEETNGVAHFLEHVSFKGTHKRTGPSLELEIENMGGHLNAYTAREQTAFYARVFKKNVPQVMELLSDLLLNSKYEDRHIESERSVIQRELESIEADKIEYLNDLLHSAAYQCHPLGMTILGSSENINSISREDIQNYVKNNYTASRMVVVGAGGVDHDELVKISADVFAGLPDVVDTKPALVKPRIIGSEIRVRNDEMPYTYVGLAHEGVSHTSPDYFPMMIAQSILGSWDRNIAGGANVSSRLARRFAVDELVSSFAAFNICYQDTGLFGLQMVTDNKLRLDDLLYSAQYEMVRLCLDITPEEVERAKKQYLTSVMNGLDSNSLIAEDIGRSVLSFGRRLPPAELVARVSSVTVQDVRNACMERIYNRDPVLVGIGAIEGLPEYNRVERATAWLRY
ncbi:hypothetical protein H696_01367 [Fonticula alba]|uniref:Mitochondrial-processing peptidase subunit beta n=1 Tax=Fonticula alba TaxID=691883 RepID=A0A058ZDH0_FONAL|nr:hypothetical protein H696_01367 [Fonticula alba]KCV71958.1 hypothetical protein H696_01367 [Fonticula alba]|eukprot:XP_009493536.1 hypothetical protein H696_01367 [Fonticula alba]